MGYSVGTPDGWPRIGIGIGIGIDIGIGIPIGCNG